MKFAIGTWFNLGFLMTFGVLAMLLQKEAMLPGGGAVARMPLWRYYLREVPRLFEPQVMGPGTPDAAAVVVTGLEHIGLALVGGIVVAAVAWWLQRRIDKPS